MGYSIIFFLLIGSSLLYLVSEYIGAKRIWLKPSNAFGIDCMKAKDLIVQEYDSSGCLWTTRGYMVYRLRKGENYFERVARIPIDLSIYWLNNFRIFRKITLRSENVELTINTKGQLTAFASGWVFFSQGIGHKFSKIMKLDHFGLKTGRGIMSTGLLQANNTELFIGEYFSNPKRTKVKVYSINNVIKTEEVLYEFKPGEIRHIHALQRDPYTNFLWICVGDEDHESMIGWSDNNYENITPIGSGSQIWRTCQLVFTESYVFWGTDTGSSNLAGIYRYDKNRKEVEKVQSIQGAVFFSIRLRNGLIIMSTDREGFPNEEDDKTRLILIEKNQQIRTLLCGTWNYKKHGLRFNFAKLRFQRSNGDDSLVMSVLNQKEFSESELIIYPEKNLV